MIADNHESPEREMFERALNVSITHGRLNSDMTKIFDFEGKPVTASQIEKSHTVTQLRGKV
jgi:hypothetical protein